MGIFSSLGTETPKVPLDPHHVLKRILQENGGASIQKSTVLGKKHIAATKTKRSPLAIPLNQKVAFGLSMATLAASAYSYAGGSSFPVQGLGMMFQAASAFTLVKNFYTEPYTKTAFTLASMGLTFTPLKPLVQSLFTYSVLSDTYRLAKRTLRLRNETNNLTVARNLLVYGSNALHSSYNLYQSLQTTPSNSDTPPVRPTPSSPSSSSSASHESAPLPRPQKKHTPAEENLDFSPIPRSPYSALPHLTTSVETAQIPINAMLQVIKESTGIDSSSNGTDSHLAAIKATLQGPAKEAVESSGSDISVLNQNTRNTLEQVIESEAGKISERINLYLEGLRSSFPEYTGYSFSKKELVLIIKEIFLTPAEQILEGKTDMHSIMDIYKDLLSTLTENVLKLTKL